MFSKTVTTGFTETYSAQIDRLRDAADQSDCILIGGGAGLSASAGLCYSGARFDDNFGDFIEKYRYRDMYTAGFVRYGSLEEHWAYWSRHISLNRYQPAPKPVYDELLKLTAGKDYFVLTTNVDHLFQKSGFDKKRLFYTQGDYGLWQCSEPCHSKTYDNRESVLRMISEQKNMLIPSELLPICPLCGRPMAMNLRCDDSFAEDEGWHSASERYAEFLSRHEGMRTLYLELGVGRNTPGIIKYPFWKMTLKNPKATYACINLGEAVAPNEIGTRAICIDGDAGAVIRDVLNG